MIGLIFYPQDPSKESSAFHYNFKNCSSAFTPCPKNPFTIYNSKTTKPVTKSKKFIQYFCNMRLYKLIIIFILTCLLTNF